MDISENESYQVLVYQNGIPIARGEARWTDDGQVILTTGAFSFPRNTKLWIEQLQQDESNAAQIPQSVRVVETRGDCGLQVLLDSTSDDSAMALNPWAREYVQAG